MFVGQFSCIAFGPPHLSWLGFVCSSACFPDCLVCFCWFFISLFVYLFVFVLIVCHVLFCLLVCFLSSLSLSSQTVTLAALHLSVCFCLFVWHLLYMYKYKDNITCYQSLNRSRIITNKNMSRIKPTEKISTSTCLARSIGNTYMST